MLNMSRTLMHQSREIALVPGYTVLEEGVPLVSMLVDGVEAVKGFEGTNDVSAGVKFVGFSYSETLTPLTANQSLTAVTDSNGHVLLPYEPITGQISVWTKNPSGARTRITSTNVTIEIGNPRMIKVTSDGSAAIADTPVDIVYKYMPTLKTAFFEHRVLIPSVSASAMTQSIGVILEGEVWTDKIDLSADFEKATNKLFINQDGLVSADASVPGTGLEINAKVIGIPGSDKTGTPSGSGGFLGLRF